MSDTPQDIQIVSKIAELRRKTKLTQLELSQLIGVTVPTIQNWERGRAGIEQIERVIKLCQVFDCQPEDLIEYMQVSQVPVSETENGKSQPKGQEQPEEAGQKANQSRKTTQQPHSSKHSPIKSHV